MPGEGRGAVPASGDRGQWEQGWHHQSLAPPAKPFPADEMQQNQ